MNRRPTISRLVLLSLIVVQLAILSYLLLSGRGEGAPDLNHVGQANVPPAGPLSLEQAYEIGVERATAWNSDATLLLAGLQLDWPVTLDEARASDIAGGGWATFVFISQANGDSHALSMMIERRSGIIYGEERLDWPNNARSESALGHVPITSIDAARIAEDVAGRDYRLACPMQRSQTRLSLSESGSTGADNETQPPRSGATPVASAVQTVETPALIGSPSAVADAVSWVITYSDRLAPGTNALTIEIDAITGRVLLIANREPACQEIQG